MNYPVCKSHMNFSLVQTGGCCGHDGDSRCYCDSPDFHVEFTCTNGKCKTTPSRWGRTRTVVRPPELGDQYAIARFIEKHYKQE